MQSVTDKHQNDNNNNNNNHDDIYSAVIIAEHCETSLGSRDEYRNGARWLPTFGQSQPTWAAGPLYRLPVNRIHHRHLLSLLSAKADTHITIQRRVEGLSRPRWLLHTEMVYTSVDGHPSKY